MVRSELRLPATSSAKQRRNTQILSEEDKMRRFRGRWALIAAGARCTSSSTSRLVTASPATTGGMVRRSSEPTLDGAQATRSHLDEELAQVRGILEEILPVEPPSFLRRSPEALWRGDPQTRHRTEPHPAIVVTTAPEIPDGESSPSSDEVVSRRSSNSRGGDGAPNLEGTGKFQNHILERFRQQLLSRFLSLHDAFERLNHDVSRDRALTQTEFRNALDRLGMGEQDPKEIFAAMDTHCDGGVTLSEFLHALVDVSPEALLWELRCRLIRFNIGPYTLNKALELVQWPQHGWLSRATKVKRRITRRSTRGSALLAAAASTSPAPTASGHDAPGTVKGDDLISALDETPKGKSTSIHFTRGDWLKLCTSMYLTLLEAERLHKYLADPDRGTVDLRAMFETLRTTVEPNVPLERFVTKAIVRYDSLDNAFNCFCEDRSSNKGVMRWSGFYSMAVSLNVNDHCAEELWKVLSTSQESAHMGPGELDGKSGVVVPREVFLRELAVWAPDTELGVLKGQLCERFGNLAEGHRALEQQLQQKDNLSAQELEARLRAAGIKNCNVENALRTVTKKDGRVSLESAIDTMHAIRPRSGKIASKIGDGARSAVRNQTQPLWEQLREVQSDMRRGFSSQSTRDFGADADGTSLHPQSSPPKAVDKRKFTEAIHGAVRTADTTRSRSVLHQAHRQVLKLEERWAVQPPSSQLFNRSRHPSLVMMTTAPGGYLGNSLVAARRQSSFGDFARHHGASDGT